MKVVLARSFARIHETNLKKQGILPLAFADPADWDKVEAQDRVDVLGLAGLAPGKAGAGGPAQARRPDLTIQARHTLTAGADRLVPGRLGPQRPGAH